MATKKYLQLCEKYFETKDLYQVLGIENKKGVTDKDVKNAYRRLSLKIHPDRVPEDEKEIATEKFKIVSKAHSILSDPKKRAAYDDNGDIDDDVECDWMNYWRSIFKTITVDDIKNYEEKYKNSEEERKDIIEVYLRTEGNMDVIMETVLFTHLEDEPRIKNIINNLIKKKEIPDFEAFSQESRDKQKRRERKMKRQRKAFEEMQEKEREAGVNNMSSLEMALARNKEHREHQCNDFFSALEKKYSKPKAEKKTRTSGRNKK